MSKRVRPRPSPLLAALRKKCWTYGQGAEFLRMSKRRLAALARGEREPKRLTIWQEEGILALTGELPEDLWPAYGRRNGLTPVLQEPKAAKLSPELLISRGLLQLPETPDELLERRDLERALQRALTRLGPRLVRTALQTLLYGTKHAEIGLELGSERVWIATIAARAMRKLHHDSWLAEFQRNRTPMRRR